jgi:adenylate kinase
VKKKVHDIWKLNQLTQITLKGKEFESIIQSGSLVPDDKIIRLIKHELAQRNWLNSQSSWLLDGFPRTFPQAKALDKDLQEHDAMLNLVVELDVPEEVILDRIENRYVVSLRGADSGET